MPEQFFWLVATSEGRPILIFGDRDENTARQKGLETLPGIDFRLVKLPTSNLQRASSLLRGKTLDETHDLRQATARQTHERGLKYRLNRSRRTDL